MRGRVKLACAAFALATSPVWAGKVLANEDVFPVCGTGIPFKNATQAEREQSYQAVVVLRFADRMPLFSEDRVWSVGQDDYVRHSVIFADCQARWQIIAEGDIYPIGVLEKAIRSDKRYSRDDLVALLHDEDIGAVVKIFDPAHCACTVPLEARLILYPKANTAPSASGDN